MTPLPSLPDREHERTEWEHTLHQSEWSVDVHNYRELGDCVAAWNHRIGNERFIGTVTMVVEDNIRRMEITLYHEYPGIDELFPKEKAPF